MTLATLLDHFGVSVSALSGVLAAREKGLGAIRYRLSLPSFKTPDTI